MFDDGVRLEYAAGYGHDQEHVPDGRLEIEVGGGFPVMGPGTDRNRSLFSVGMEAA